MERQKIIVILLVISVIMSAIALIMNFVIIAGVSGTPAGGGVYRQYVTNNVVKEGGSGRIGLNVLTPGGGP